MCTICRMDDWGTSGSRIDGATSSAVGCIPKSGDHRAFRFQSTEIVAHTVDPVPVQGAKKNSHVTLEVRLFSL